MKTILVPTDFSDAASNASEYAADLAKRVGAKILLFHAYHVPIPATDAPLMFTADELQEVNEKKLKEEAVRLNKKTGVEINYSVKMGFAEDEILEKEKGTDLIIMGMKGTSTLMKTLLGSISTATVRKAKTPVLLIPEKAKFKNIEKIVFACDYEPKTDGHTLDALKELMKTFGAKVYVVNVKRKKESAVVEETKMKTTLLDTTNDVEQVYYFPDKEDLVEGINEFIEDNHADMVAIIPHRHNLMDRLFHKSISKQMVFHAHVPVLALPENHKSIPAFFV